MELRQEMSGPFDRAGHELREKADERGEPKEVAFTGNFPQVEVDGVTHRLEREE